MKKIMLVMLSLIITLIPANIIGVTRKTKTYSIQAEEGYRVVDVIVNGVSQGVIESYTFTQMDGPQTLKVVTEKIEGATTYQVTFNANGGLGTMESQTFEEGLPQNLVPNRYTKEGYNFIGWSKTLDGEVEYDNEASYTATSNETLYAVWFEKPLCTIITKQTSKVDIQGEYSNYKCSECGGKDHECEGINIIIKEGNSSVVEI